MSMYNTLPFDIDIALKIRDGEMEGRFVTESGYSVRIVCWDANSTWPIVALIDCGTFEKLQSYNFKGEHVWSDLHADMNLMIQVPCKDEFAPGDIVCFGLGNIGIFSKFGPNDTFESYATLIGNAISFYRTGWDASNIQHADEDSRNKMMNTLRNRPHLKQAREVLADVFHETADYIESAADTHMNNDHQAGFHEFEKVLVRDADDCYWRPRFFSNMEDKKFKCTDALIYKHCIRYEGNENLCNKKG